MIIDNFNLTRLPIPHKTNPPLCVDAYAVLTCAIAVQLLQMIGRRHTQKMDVRRRMNLLQFTQGNRFKMHKPRHALACE